jgi:nucleoside-diphosphate-sugar epimerase
MNQERKTAMKVFVAGASGAIGKRLVPLLVAAGYDVVAMTHRATKARALRQVGVQPVVADGLDRNMVMKAVMRTEPDVVIHQMTALAGVTSVKHFDHDFALTNRLRTDGTDILLSAAVAAGARRFIAQSFGNWNYEREGGPVKSEGDPLDADPPAAMRESLASLRHLEQATVGATELDGLALRYGNLYGPGTSFSATGPGADLFHQRKFPVIGDGTGIWSFIHVDDAALATLAAVERGAPGVYNVCDDDPAPAAVWVPALADALRAKPPRHVPRWLGRIAAGEPAVSMFTQIRGAANGKAKRELGWTPNYGTWRAGFREGLHDQPRNFGLAARLLGLPTLSDLADEGAERRAA